MGNWIELVQIYIGNQKKELKKIYNAYFQFIQSLLVILRFMNINFQSLEVKFREIYINASVVVEILKLVQEITVKKFSDRHYSLLKLITMKIICIFNLCDSESAYQSRRKVPIKIELIIFCLYLFYDLVDVQTMVIFFWVQLFLKFGSVMESVLMKNIMKSSGTFLFYLDTVWMWVLVRTSLRDSLELLDIMVWGYILLLWWTLNNWYFFENWVL